ncbi:MAG TPA: hypothetical protein PKH97_14775 [Tetrasphaera sp.]|uniref:hypothetical protein n=1 Tax=Nostocoides sp. TaxID=1917966 RepID=UPI002BD37929|nr:hypothetical protein [Tetrasphaera sp.]HNQ08438.1 hypothetical protein [Tetrasphaera sp.]
MSTTSTRRRRRGGAAFITGVILALAASCGGVSAITPGANQAPSTLANYDEP